MINEMTAVLADSMFSIVVHLSHPPPPIWRAFIMSTNCTKKHRINKNMPQIDGQRCNLPTYIYVQQVHDIWTFHPSYRIMQHTKN